LTELNRIYLRALALHRIRDTRAVGRGRAVTKNPTPAVRPGLVRCSVRRLLLAASLTGGRRRLPWNIGRGRLRRGAWRRQRGRGRGRLDAGGIRRIRRAAEDEEQQERQHDTAGDPAPHGIGSLELAETLIAPDIVVRRRAEAGIGVIGVRHRSVSRLVPAA